MTAQLILVRHGESESNVLRIATSALRGYPLTERGRAQAGVVADALAGTGVVRVYSSPVERAQQTAEIVAGQLGLTVTVFAGLEEIDVGVLEGRSEDEAASHGVTNFARWLTDEDLQHGFEGGETGHQVIARVRARLEEIAGGHDGETVVVVSHGGALALSLVDLCDNVTPRFAWEHLLDNCAAVFVTVEADRWTCTSWAGIAPADQLCVGGEP